MLRNPKKLKSKKTWTYNGLIVDSQEEYQFCYWLDEVKASGYIKEWVYHPKEILLFDKTQVSYEKQLKTKSKTTLSFIFSARKYTPDFFIIWDESANKVFADFLRYDCSYQIYESLHMQEPTCELMATKNVSGEYISYIDTKGGFNKSHSQQSQFGLVQAILADRGILINKVIPHDGNTKKPKCLFKETFVPRRLMYTEKQMKEKTYHYATKTIVEFIEWKIKN
jgi:hypothetical protein